MNESILKTKLKMIDEKLYESFLLFPCEDGCETPQSMSLLEDARELLSNLIENIE